MAFGGLLDRALASRKNELKKMAPSVGELLLSVVFFRNIILGNFVRLHFGDVGVGRPFHTCDYFRFEALPFLEQFRDALGIGIFNLGNSLRVPGLPARF